MSVVVHERPGPGDPRITSISASSMAERPTVNRMVPGSNPGWRAAEVGRSPSIPVTAVGERLQGTGRLGAAGGCSARGVAPLGRRMGFDSLPSAKGPEERDCWFAPMSRRGELPNRRLRMQGPCSNELVRRRPCLADSLRAGGAYGSPRSGTWRGFPMVGRRPAKPIDSGSIPGRASRR